LNDPGDKGEFEVDQDIEEANVYSSFEDTAQDWELQQEVNELADAIDRIMGAK
jgi:transcription elongation factor Elf1